MPYAVVEFQPTPNPNALKCVLDRPLPAPPEASASTAPLRSYRSAAAAAPDAPARTLFGVQGVMSVLIGEGWVTITKAPGADWGPIKKQVKAALAAMS